jgi:peptide deformylase
MTLVRYPNPILKVPAERVAPGDDVTDLLVLMRVTLAQEDGLGLAAQQVGDTRRVALVTFGGKCRTAINLEITERSKAMQISPREGCLSVRSGGEVFRMTLRRHQRVRVRYEDDNRETHEHWVGGLDAIVAQHEVEHLDGKCIIDRLATDQLAHLFTRARKA